MKFFLALLAVLLLSPDPAQAGGLATAFALIQNGVAVGAAITATYGAVGAFLIRAAASAAFSLLGQALQKKPKKPGLQTEYTTTGGTEPQSFILGRYATSGHMVYMNSHGKVGKRPNAYLTYVIEVSDLPGVTLSRVIVNGEYCTLGDTDHADYGTPLTNLQNKSGQDRAWIKFYDGTQTAADPMLVDKYGSDPERPWGSTFIGTGIAYAILTFRLDRKVFSGFPKVRFELDGVPWYDIRKDSTAGGSGTHRWDDPSTWEQTENPIVIAYNIARGVTMPCGALFGGGVAAGNLPVSNWAAAMNACDVEVGSPARPAYRAGFEVRVGPKDLGGDEPAEVIEELLKACGGQITETGGVFRVRVGGPGAPVLHITDADLAVTDPQQFNPFPGLESTYNGISYTHPSPTAVWEGREGEPIYNSTYETEDGGRRLIADLQLPACPYPEQASQLAHAYIEDERRFRQHRIYLPPEYAALEGLDAITWTSAWNGYIDKVFEVTGGEYMPKSQVVAVDLRERDSGDFDYDAAYDIPAAPISTTPVRPDLPYVLRVENGRFETGDFSEWAVEEYDGSNGGGASEFSIVQRSAAASNTAVQLSPSINMVQLDRGSTGLTSSDHSRLIYEHLIPVQPGQGVYMSFRHAAGDPDPLIHGGEVRGTLRWYDEDSVQLASPDDETDDQYIFALAPILEAGWWKTWQRASVPPKEAAYCRPVLEFRAGVDLTFVTDVQVNVAFDTARFEQDSITDKSSTAISTTNLAADSTLETIATTVVTVPELSSGTGGEALAIEANVSGNVDFSAAGEVTVRLFIDSSNVASGKLIGDGMFAMQGLTAKTAGDYDIELKAESPDVSDVTITEATLTGKVFKR